MLALALWCVASAGAARAGSVTYVVDFDTTGLASSAGFIDFQFNPNGSGALAADLSVTNDSGGSGYTQVGQAGDASGTLPGDLTFDNATALNELTFSMTYGTSLSFDVTISGPAVGGTATDGSTFSMSLADGGGNLLSNGPATVTIVVNPDGSTTGTAYPPASGSYPAGTVALATVPEPSSMVSAALGLVTIVGWSRARRRPAA